MTNGYNTPIGVPIGLPSILSLGLPPLVNPYPTLNLDFINNPQFDSRITFTRGSQATLFDSTGTLRYAKHNLATYSQEPSDAAWNKTRASITADTIIAPDGTLTGDKLVEDTTASNTHRTSVAAISIVSGFSYTWSIYLKAGERTFAFVALHTGSSGNAFTTLPSLYVNLLTGEITNASATVTASSAVDVGDGWWRVSISATATLTTTNNPAIFLATASGTNSYTGDGTSGLYLWGAQLNQTPMEGGVTSSLTTYYPTTTAAYYAPRFDYNPSTLQPRGLLIEEARTNSIRNNTMVGAVAGTPGTVPTNWSAVSIGGVGLTEIVGVGTENGINYVDVRFAGTTSSTATGGIQTDGTTTTAALSGQVWASSAFLKLVGGSTTGITSFNVSIIERSAAGGFLAQTNTPVSPTSASLNTQRYATTRTLNNASTAFVQQRISVIPESGVAIDFTLRIGLPQLELGSFATSVIPTTTTALTRNADVASMTGTNFSSWYNASEGTIVAEYVYSTTGVSNQCAYSLDNGTSSETIIMASTTPAIDRPLSSAGGVAQLTGGLGNYTFTAQQLIKRAVAYKLNDYGTSVNGGAAATDTTYTVPSPDRLVIGAAGYFSGSRLNGTIRRIAYYDTRLTNAQLQALTT